MTSKQEVMPFLSGEVPAHLINKGSLGNESIDSEDLAIPRLNLIQALSAQMDKTKPEFVSDAEIGLFHQSVSNELLESVYVVNLFYLRTVAAFRDRDLGGGFGGNHASRQEAIDKLTEEGKDPKQYDLVDTANHYLLMLDENGVPKSPVIFSMSGSKMKISKLWNSQILALGDDIPRFGSVWKLSSVTQSNAKGSWANAHIDFMGYASAELTDTAEEFYTQFADLRDDAVPKEPVAA